MFQRNIEAIKKNNSELAFKLQKIDLAQISHKFAVEKAHSGDLIILYKEKPLDDINSPLAAAKQIFDNTITSTLKNNDIVIVFGFGLGYLFKRAIVSTEAKILLYEPNIEIIRYVLEYVDFSNELSQNRIFITNSLNYCTALIQNKFIAKDKIEILFNKQYAIIEKEKLTELTSSILKSCEMKLTDINTIGKFAKLWVENIIKNLKKTNKIYPINVLKNSANGKLAVIAAAGPSLQNCIKDIKANRNKLTIFAVNKVFDYLIAQGITPDFAVFLDAARTEFTIASDKTAFNDVNIISTLRTDTFPLSLPYKNAFIAFCDNDVFSEKINQFISKKIELIKASSTAVGLAYHCAKFMDFTEIAFCGLDLAFKDKCAYANNYNVKIENNKVILEYAEQKGHVCVKSFDGKIISSRDDYKNAIHQFEDFFYNEQKAKIYNTTDFGAYIKGMDYKPLSEILKNNNLPHLYNQKNVINSDFTEHWAEISQQIIDVANNQFQQLDTIRLSIENNLNTTSLIAQFSINSIKPQLDIINSIAKNIFLEQYLEIELLDIITQVKNKKINTAKMFDSFFEITLKAIQKIKSLNESD